jgi:hypothetical protein
MAYNYLGGTEKNNENRIADVPAEVGTEHLPNLERRL